MRMGLFWVSTCCLTWHNNRFPWKSKMDLTYNYVKLLVQYVITVQMCSVIRTFMWEQFHKKITEPWITKESLKLLFQISITISQHTLDMLWEMFQSILPLYMKPITFQSKASVAWSVTTAVSNDFCLEKLNVFPHILVKKTRNWNVYLVSVLITSWYIT